MFNSFLVPGGSSLTEAMDFEKNNSPGVEGKQTSCFDQEAEKKY